MTDTTATIIIVIVVAMLVAFVIAVWWSYKVTRSMQKQNEHMANLLSKKSDHPSPDVHELRKAAKEMIQTNAQPDNELLEWVEQQIEERELYKLPDTSLKNLSRELGLTQKRLNEVVSASHYGSLVELIACKRVECACRLLETKTEWSIEAISEEAGFTTRRTFQNLFKAHTGVTPTQYRAIKARSSGNS